MSELEPRLIERLRAELAELMAASVAYPPFFDFRANRLVTRPIDRTRRDEIQRFLNSANFTPIERSNVSAPETRRFLERLILRYIEVNEALRGRYSAAFASRLRAHAPRLAAEAQRRALGYLNGSVPDFGARRQAVSWGSASRRVAGRSGEERERATHVLESALMRRGSASPLPESTATPTRRPSAPAQDPWQGLPEDVTVPVPAAAYPGYDSSRSDSPFAAFRAAPPTPEFISDISGRLSEQPTGPLLAAPNASAPSTRAPLRDLPPDLYQLYGDYLNDMEPAAAAVRPSPPQPPYPPRAAPPSGNASRNTSATTSDDARNDQLIFWQLRYQLEAYVRRAARNYGAPHSGADPATVLDELRRSGFVDEADLRIAESVFALTDRVTARGHATEPEYRQALMLYLLYHRSHLNL